MASLRFEQLFKMSAFEALRVLRNKTRERPELKPEEVVSLLQETHTNSASFDFESALHLHDMVEETTGVDIISFYRCCITAVLLECGPDCINSVTLGRKFFVKKLTRDDVSIFREADLLNEPPEIEVVTWWDHLKCRVRNETNLSKVEQGRKAERLSFEYELKKIEESGIKEKPVWIAIDNETAGYDIKSYERIGNEVKVKKIEVKSTISSPLRFYLTRNEWRQAVSSGEDVYLFHVWDLSRPDPVLHKRSLDYVKSHIPTDNDKGEWSQAVIPLGHEEGNEGIE